MYTLKKVVLVLSVFAHGFLFAQPQNQKLVPRVVPPSPDAAAIQKYGSIPVGLHTGVPSIEIPLYTIKTDKLQVPISISYHASGIRVNEIASWVGLGWVLNAGGVISRSVVGKPDDISGFWTQAVKNTSQINWTNDWGYLKGMADGLIDGESDYYFYNFNGRSGKFVYLQNQGNQVPFLIPEEPIKVLYGAGGYEIVDVMGIHYKFGSVENMGFTDSNLQSYTYASSYYLSEIISADGTDHIYFTYLPDNSYSENNIYTYTETIGQMCSGPGTPTNGYHITNYTTDTRQVSSIRLSQISFDNGKIDFIVAGPRSDVPPKRLQEIKISAKNRDGSYSHYKSFVLGEDYFVSTTGTGKDKYRLKLSGLTEVDPQSNISTKYTFAYNETVQLPHRISLAQDWWGYYNGQTANSSLVATETISFMNSNYQVGSANRQPNATYMQGGMLKKITYPTGGFTELDYEPHYYGTSVTMAGGLRIKETRDYDGISTTPVTKVYKYGLTENGAGTLLMPADVISTAKQETNFIYTYTSPGNGSCLVGCGGSKMLISGRAAFDLSTFNGSPVVYDYVTVYESNSSGPNGKQKYQFNVVADQTMGTDKNYNNGRYQLNDSWKGGNELWNGVYYSGISQPVLETTTTSSLVKNSQAAGTKIGWKVTFEGCGYTTMNNSDAFYAFDYPLYSGIKKTTATKITTHASNDLTKISETITNYEYANVTPQHQQMTKQTITNSAGEVKDTRYWYPADYGNIDAIPSLKTNNIIAKPVKTETYKNNIFASGQVNRMDQYGNPYEIYQYQSATLQAPVAHNSNILVPSNYVKRIDIQYDPTSKNISSTKMVNDINASYLWGYNNEFPIAMAVNANVADIAASSFESNGQGNWMYTGNPSNDIAVKTGTQYYKLSASNITKSLAPGKYKLEYWGKGTITLSGGTITAVRTSPADADGWILYEKEINVTSTVTLTIGGGTGSIDELRLYPSTAQMTTYTYDVVKGVTSVTDGNNFTKYYDYDAFGRLKWIKDHNKHIIKTYDYHHKNN